MKIVSITVGIKQGLPNYSSRTADAVAVADEGESLDIKRVVLELSNEIKTAWSPATPPPVVISPEACAKIEAALEKSAVELGLPSKVENKVVKLPKKAKPEPKPEPENFLAGLLEEGESKPIPAKKKISNPLDDED